MPKEQSAVWIGFVTVIVPKITEISIIKGYLFKTMTSVQRVDLRNGMMELQMVEKIR